VLQAEKNDLGRHCTLLPGTHEDPRGHAVERAQTNVHERSHSDWFRNPMTWRVRPEALVSVDAGRRPCGTQTLRAPQALNRLLPRAAFPRVPKSFRGQWNLLHIEDCIPLTIG